MNVLEFLGKRGRVLDEVGEEVAAKLALQEDECLFVAGSLVEGLGNNSSDLDIYLVSDNSERLANRSTTLALDAADCLVDLEVYSFFELEALTERFRTWAAKPRVVGACFEISERERLHLHRLVNAVPLHGDTRRLNDIQKDISPASLARHKLDWSIAWIRTLQVDLQGLFDIGDWETMLPVSNDVLGYTADALLAPYMNTNPTPKWRFPLLRRLPSDWEHGIPGRSSGKTALEMIVDLLQTPQPMNATTVYQRALTIVGFSRRILPWAESKLVATGEELPNLPADLPLSATPPLGALGLSVHFAYQAEQFEVFNLNRHGYRCAVSASLLALLSLFDGTSREGHVNLLDKGIADHLNEVQSLVRFGGFLAEPLVNSERLHSLLIDHNAHG